MTDFGISAVAIGASQAHRAGAVHGGAVGGGVAGDAAGGFAVGVGLGLQEEDVWLGRLSSGHGFGSRMRWLAQSATGVPSWTSCAASSSKSYDLITYLPLPHERGRSRP